MASQQIPCLLWWLQDTRSGDASSYCSTCRRQISPYEVKKRYSLRLTICESTEPIQRKCNQAHLTCGACSIHTDRALYFLRNIHNLAEFLCAPFADFLEHLLSYGQLISSRTAVTVVGDGLNSLFGITADEFAAILEEYVHLDTTFQFSRVSAKTGTAPYRRLRMGC